MTAETSNARGEWVLERLRGVLEHGKMGDKCLIAPDLVTAAIAALSAQQSPAEAQPVATLVNRKDADGGKTTTFIRPAGLGLDLPIGEYPLHLHPPPSAPVGVEWPLSLLRAGHWREVYIGHRCMRLEVTYDYATWERLMAEVESALAQQPAAVGEEIMVNAAHDVFTLPLQPSGLSSGPRFVVHVPAPEQQPAPQSAPVGVEGLIEEWESDLAEDKRDGVSEVAIRAQEIHLDQLRALAQQPAAARVDVRGLVAKLAAHVRPTCSELWDEAQAFLAAEGVQAEPNAEARGVVDEEAVEPCESGLPDCGHAVTWDSEGVGVCERCGRELGWLPALTGEHNG